MEKISVEKLRPETYQEWDAFVQSTPGGMPLHLSAWQGIFSRIYGFQCEYYLARTEEGIQGVLPLYLVRSPITGYRLESPPGALCAKTEAAARTLIDSADALANDLRVNYILLRDSRFEWNGCGLDVVSNHRGIRCLIDKDLSELWSSLSKNLRYKIRKSSRRAAVDIDFSTQSISDFYHVLSTFYRWVGTPIFSYHFLQAIKTAMPDNCQIINAYSREKPVAGYFCFCFQDYVHYFWGGALANYRALNVNYQVYWAMFEFTARSGYRILDLGRSPYPSGCFNFKSMWGQEDYPFFQLYRVFRGQRPPVLDLIGKQNRPYPVVKAIPQEPLENACPQAPHPTKDKAPVRTFAAKRFSYWHALFRETWKRLPVFITRMLGPWLRRQIPFG